MQKSFIERIFPQPSSPLLPTSRGERPSRRTSLQSTPSPVVSGPSSSPSRLRHASPPTSQSLQPAPLSASIIHHSDPLLPVDRAARALQKTIQSLLDAQSDGLSAGLGDGSRDDVSSVGSLTPTPSIATPPRSTRGLKTTPIRQPVTKKISLRGARKGLTSSIEDFAQLKEEELRILASQSKGRQTALEKVHALEDKRSALASQIEAIKHEETSTSADQLHKEAQQLDVEIRELEDKLMELKAQTRHILAQASQIKNSVSSKLSSYTSSLGIVDREIKQFLKQPPVPSKLAIGADMGQSMYDLKPERRTLDMAKEQWINEQTLLDEKRKEAEQEKAAFEDGTVMWRQILDRINAFEKDLRVATRGLSKPATEPADPEKEMHELLPTLDTTIDFLESGLQRAEENHWNLLICCIGPELDVFQQSRTILRQTLGLPPLDSTPEYEEDLDGPDHDLLNSGAPHSLSAESNKSLEETMQAFGDQKSPDSDAKDNVGRSFLADLDKDRGFGFGPTTNAESESEEDDPGPDFLLSHS